MSWNDVFPVMDDELLEVYRAKASEQEKEALAQLFGVESVHNRQKPNHVVATGLFWKPADVGDQRYPEPTKEVMQNPKHFGLLSRFENPWDHYVKPVLKAAAHLREVRPDLVYRVYLAKDLKFILEDLVEAGCEVFLMRSSSINHNPGAMWRFLAMEEDCMVTMNDADLAENLIHDVARTETVAAGGLNFWRSPYFFTLRDLDVGSPGGYHTSSAGLMGSAKSLPIRDLCEAFVWCCDKGLMQNYCILGERRVHIVESAWPNFGFDEWFINAVIYPRVAFEGVLTFAF